MMEAKAAEWAFAKAPCEKSGAAITGMRGTALETCMHLCDAYIRLLMFMRERLTVLSGQVSAPTEQPPRKLSGTKDRMIRTIWRETSAPVTRR